jgi:sRNA-binding protein
MTVGIDPGAGQKRPSVSIAGELDQLLQGLWPGQLRELFGENPLPLAIGISDQIAEALAMDAGERRQLGLLLRKWTSTAVYLRSLRRAGSMRHGLDGAVVEPVSEDHRAHARERLDQRAARWKRRREQEERQAAKAAAAERAFRINAAKPRLRLRLGKRP